MCNYSAGMDDDHYRHCVGGVDGNDCPYMKRNKYGTSCCSIDGVTGVDYYGCSPSEILGDEDDWN